MTRFVVIWRGRVTKGAWAFNLMRTVAPRPNERDELIKRGSESNSVANKNMTIPVTEFGKREIFTHTFLQGESPRVYDVERKRAVARKVFGLGASQKTRRGKDQKLFKKKKRKVRLRPTTALGGVRGN